MCFLFCTKVVVIVCWIVSVSDKGAQLSRLAHSLKAVKEHNQLSVCCGHRKQTLLKRAQDGRSRVRFPVRSLDFQVTKPFFPHSAPLGLSTKEFPRG
jgi:hypothetical protein